jgi:hypothetical protein
VQNNIKSKKERYKELFKQYQPTISMVVSVVAITLVLINMVACNLQMEDYKHNMMTQLQYEGIAVSIIREAEPNDNSPEIIDIPEIRAPSKQINEAGLIVSWTYHFSVDLVNMTSSYFNIWLKIYIPNVVYDHFDTIRAVWTAINNKLEEETGNVDKSDFVDVQSPVSGFLASVNTEFEIVVWRNLYTGPVKVDIELIP